MRTTGIVTALGTWLVAAVLLTGCTPARSQADLQKPMLVHGGGGTRIAVYEYGDPGGPEVLLVHGFSQSHLSWAKQYRAPAMQHLRIVVIDLRGHGASEKPTNAEYYSSSDVWADDVAAVIEAKSLRKPVMAGWSYGGYIISDYVRKYGDGRLGGIVFVGAGTQVRTDDSKTHYGPGIKHLLGMLDPRQEVNIPSTVEFIKACTAKPLPADEFQEALAYNMAVSPEVRAAMSSRRIDSSDVLVKISVPVLIVHGEKDPVILPAAGDYIAGKVKHAKKSYYPNAAHSPFLEEPERFNRELAEFAKQPGN